jgi:hypothetical protein
VGISRREFGEKAFPPHLAPQPIQARRHKAREAAACEAAEGSGQGRQETEEEVKYHEALAIEKDACGMSLERRIREIIENAEWLSGSLKQIEILISQITVAADTHTKTGVSYAIRRCVDVEPYGDEDARVLFPRVSLAE